MLTPLDYVIIVLYSGVLILMGAILAKRASGGLEDYFLGGRNLPWYFLGCSGMAAWFDLTGTMVITSFLFMIGPKALYIGFRGDAVLVLVFLMAFTAKWHRRSGVMTGAEWMEFRFGGGADANAARLLTAIASILPVIGLIAYLMKGTGLFLSMFFPFSPEICAGALIFVAVLYTMMSGYYGVVISDVFQSLLIIVTCCVVGVMAFSWIPDAGGISLLAEKVHGVAGWSDSTPEMRIDFPGGMDSSEYDAYRFLGMAIAYFLVQTSVFGLASGADPKYFAARSDRDVCKLNLLIGWLITIRWPMMMGLAVIGLHLVKDTFEDRSEMARAAQTVRAYTPDLEKSDWHRATSRLITHPEAADPALIRGLEATLGPKWKAKLPLVGYEGGVDPERILPAVILNYVPTGLIGIIIVTALAATMSTFDSTLNTASAYVVKDMYQRWIRPGARQKELISVAWITTAGLALLGFFAGFHFSSINEVWDWVLMSLMTGLFVPNFLRLYWWRMNGWGVALGMASGAVAAISQTLLFPDFPYWAKFTYVTVIAFSGTIAGCLLTQPTEMKTLIHFYAKTRPFGLWGPVRQHFSREQLQYIDSENSRDALSLPFIFVYQVMLFLIPMQIIIHRFDSLFWSLPLFVAGCLGTYFIWFKNQRPDRAMEEEVAGCNHESRS